MVPSELRPSSSPRSSAAAAIRPEKYSGALIALMHDALLGEAGQAGAFRRFTEAVSRMVGVERTSVWRFTPDRSAIEAVDLFEASRARHSAGRRISGEDVPAYFEALATNQVLSAHDALSDRRTREFAASYLEPHGITSMLDAPVLLEGRLGGVVCLEHVGEPRRWTPEEQAMAISAANVAALLFLEDARARAESELRESRRRLQTLMDHLPGMAYRCRNDPDWTMEMVSAGVRGLTGYAPEDLLPGGGVHFGDLIHPDDRNAVWVGVQEALEGDRPFQLIYRIRTREDEERWVWEQGQQIPGSPGGEPAIEGFIIDITEQKRLERQLVESQKMESVGRLAGGIAHDFNNLLSVILGTTDLALSGSAVGSPVREDLVDIRAAAERAAELTRQLLALGRRQPIQPRVVDLNALLDGILKLLRRIIGEDVEMVVATAVGLPPVRVDPGQIEQVLTNLVTNARDAMPQGGTLRLETGAVPFGGLPSGRPAVEVTVRDTGTGMSPEVMARVFEPFFTTKAPGEGTGLGLAMVYGIVQQNGGRVAVESRPGEGTTFRILLPVAEPAPPTAEGEDAGTGGVGGLAPGEEGLRGIPDPSTGVRAAVTPDPASHPHATRHSVSPPGTILLVEDEDRLGRLAERILRREGYGVLRATRGEWALELLERHGPVDLLVTDVVMPGLSGPQVADAVLARHPETRVLFTSGYPRHHPVAPADTAGPKFLPKPYSREGLLEAVYGALRG